MTPPPRPRHPDAAQGRLGGTLARLRHPVPVPMGMLGAPVLAQGPVTSQRGGWSCQRAPGEGTALGGHIQSKRGAPSPTGTPRRKAPRRAGTLPAVPPTGAGDDLGTAGLWQHCTGQGKWPRQPPSKAGSGLQTPFFCRQDFPWQLRGPARPPAPCGALGVTAARPPRTSVPFPHLGFPISVSTGGRDAGGPLLGEATRELWHAAVPHGDSGFFQTGSQGH